MRLFNRYPTVDYRFGTLKSSAEFTNLSVYADVLDSIKDDSSLYSLVDVRDGERPDLLSDRLYRDSTLGWTFAFMNDAARTGNWVLGYNDFQDHLDDVLPGQFLTVNETESSPATGATILQMVSRFKNGSLVYGTNSGAIGEVYGRNANTAQLLVKITSGTFVADETIQDVIAPATPNEFLVVSEAGLATQATHHYEDENGDHVDVDPTSGIVPATYTRITFENQFERRNSELSRIRALREDVARQVAARYRDIVST